MRNKTSAVAGKFKQLSMLRLIAMAAMPLGMLLGVTAHGQATDPNANEALTACDADQSQDGDWNNEADTYTAYIGAELVGGDPELLAIQLPVHCGTTGGTYTLVKVVAGEDEEVTLPDFTIDDPDPDAAEDATVSALDGLSAAAGTAGTDAFSYQLTGSAAAAAAGTHRFELSAPNSDTFAFTVVVKNVPLTAPTLAAATDVGAYSSKTVWANPTLPGNDAFTFTRPTATATTGTVEKYALKVVVVEAGEEDVTAADDGLGSRTIALPIVDDTSLTSGVTGAGAPLWVTVPLRGSTPLPADHDLVMGDGVDVYAFVMRTDMGTNAAEAGRSEMQNTTLRATPDIGTVSVGTEHEWYLHKAADLADGATTVAMTLPNSVFPVLASAQNAASATPEVTDPDIRQDANDATDMYSYSWTETPS